MSLGAYICIHLLVYVMSISTYIHSGIFMETNDDRLIFKEFKEL